MRTYSGYLPEKEYIYLPESCILPGPRPNEFTPYEERNLYYKLCSTERYEIERMLANLAEADRGTRLQAFNSAVAVARMGSSLIN